MASSSLVTTTPENEVLNFKQRGGENLKDAWYRICVVGNEHLWDRSDPFTVRQGERIAQRADLTNSTQGIYPGSCRTDA